MIENKYGEIKAGTQKETPWVSFCIATYRRPDILEKTLRQIARQTFSDFEVIVSDNDPEQSSKNVVESLGDPKFHYYSNSTNVGMVKNFNVALSHARGSYIVMIADDDPPQTDFLTVIHELFISKPDYGAYFGACEVLIESEEAAAVYQVKVGSIRFLADAPLDAIRCFSREQFPQKYLEREVFPYTLWSTGIVRRDIAIQVGGMPDYGSPLLTDLSYVAAVGSHAGCATINKVLGGQVVHGENSGMVNPHDVEAALRGCRDYLQRNLSGREDWVDLKASVDHFLATYIAGHCSAMNVFLGNRGNRDGLVDLQLSMERMYVEPGMEKLRSYYFRAKFVRWIRKYFWYLVPMLKMVVRLSKKLSYSNRNVTT